MLSFSLHDKEVPVEERNGDAHDEAEQAANEKEGGEGEEEVLEGETAGDEAPAEEDQVVEGTDDTVNAAPLQSIVPPSIHGMFCLLLPSSSHHSWNALFSLPLATPLHVFPFLLINGFSSFLKFLSSLCTSFVESLWVELIVNLKCAPSSVYPAPWDVKPSFLLYICSVSVCYRFHLC